MAEFDLFEIMRTTRSMRRLKTDPVPDTLLSRILECGTYAASGGNMQTWRFLVIRDTMIKEAAGARYSKAWHDVVAPRTRRPMALQPGSVEQFCATIHNAVALQDVLTLTSRLAGGTEVARYPDRDFQCAAAPPPYD